MSVRLMSLVFEHDMPNLQIDEESTVPDSTAKFVLLALADHASDDGEGAYPSISRLCKKTSMSRGTVCNAIKALRFHKYILYEGESKVHTNNYTILVDRLVQPVELPKSSHRTLNSLAIEHESSFNHPINHEEKNFSKKKIELPPGSDLVWHLLNDIPSEEIESLNKTFAARKEKTDEYERAMGYNPLPWGSKDFDVLEKFLEKQSIEDIHRFAEWSKNPYNGLSPAKARQFPRLVIDLWLQSVPKENINSKVHLL